MVVSTRLLLPQQLHDSLQLCHSNSCRQLLAKHLPIHPVSRYRQPKILAEACLAFEPHDWPQGLRRWQPRQLGGPTSEQVQLSLVLLLSLKSAGTRAPDFSVYGALQNAYVEPACPWDPHVVLRRQAIDVSLYSFLGTCHGKHPPSVKLKGLPSHHSGNTHIFDARSAG